MPRRIFVKPRQTLRDLVETVSVHQQSWPTIDISSSPRDAAVLITAAGTDGVQVLENGDSIGGVSANSLLAVLLRDEDPTTGLPRSGALRDWLTARIQEGNEVAILFFDLDRFGEINRSQGHATGDAVLQRVASILIDHCADSDFCCRFGGDEFAIGTLRSRSQAESLAEAIALALGAAGSSASFGVSGGRRSRLREDMNTAATIEDLLSLASLACIEQKQTKGREPF